MLMMPSIVVEVPLMRTGSVAFCEIQVPRGFVSVRIDASERCKAVREVQTVEIVPVFSMNIAPHGSSVERF